MATSNAMSTSAGVRKSRVSYFYKPEIGSFYYSAGHPMKPHRLKLTHHLLLTYGMYRKMEVLRPHDATAEELERFHSHEYIDFLKRVSPDMEQEFEKSMSKFNVGPYSGTCRCCCLVLAARCSLLAARPAPRRCCRRCCLRAELGHMLTRLACAQTAPCSTACTTS